VIGDYIVYSDVVAKGAEAVIRFAKHSKTGRKVVLKTMSEQRTCAYEANILQQLKHENIVELYEVIEFDGKQHLVLQYASRGDLFDHICASPNQRLPEDEALSIFCQIISGLEHVHDNAVVHRDLKPENIFLGQDGRVLIGDFGMAAVAKEGSGNKIRTEFCGSLNYIAPEILRRRPIANEKIDIWSLGVLLFVMVTGAYPFEGVDEMSTKKKILTGKFAIPAHVSEPCADLIANMLITEPDDRISLSKVRTHAWICGYFGSRSATPRPRSEEEAAEAAAAAASAAASAAGPVPPDTQAVVTEEPAGGADLVEGQLERSRSEHETKADMAIARALARALSSGQAGGMLDADPGARQRRSSSVCAIPPVSAKDYLNRALEESCDLGAFSAGAPITISEPLNPREVQHYSLAGLDASDLDTLVCFLQLRNEMMEDSMFDGAV